LEALFAHRDVHLWVRTRPVLWDQVSPPSARLRVDATAHPAQHPCSPRSGRDAWRQFLAGWARARDIHPGGDAKC
jgi:hypothetical protein